MTRHFLINTAGAALSQVLVGLGLVNIACSGQNTIESASGGSNSVGGQSTSLSGTGGTTYMLPSGGAAQGGAMGSGGASSSDVCSNASVRLVTNGIHTVPQDTGFDTCAGGTLRRRQSMVCPYGPTTPQDQCSTSSGQCNSDAQCATNPHGVCANSHQLEGYCGCFYGCMNDTDCQPGQVCLCGDPAGQCVAATCTDDASCGPSGACLSYAGGCYTAVVGFACLTSADSCASDADCASTENCVMQNGHRACASRCLPPPP